MEAQNGYEFRQSTGRELDLGQLVRMLVSRLHLIVIAAVIFALIAGGIILLTTDRTYTSKAQVYVNTAAKDYVSVLTTTESLNKIIANKDLNISASKLSKMLSITASDTNKVIEITATAGSASMAHDIAEGVTELATDDVNSYMGTERIQVTNKATTPKKPNAVNYKSKALAFGVLGALLVCIAVVVDFLRRSFTIQNEDDARRVLSLPVLGVLPEGDPAAEKGGFFKRIWR